MANFVYSSQATKSRFKYSDTSCGMPIENRVYNGATKGNISSGTGHVGNT